MPYSDPVYSSTATSAGGDTNYDPLPDVYDATPVKVAPTLGVILQGLWRPARQVGAQFMNWWMNQIGLLITALIADGLRVEDWAIAEFTKLRLIRVLNWTAGVSTDEILCACWNPVQKAWYFGKASSVVRTSLDLGVTLVAGDEGLTGTGDILDIAANLAGDMITCDNGGTLWYYDGTWTEVALVMASVNDGMPAGERPSICYDETATSWFVMGMYDGFGGAPIALYSKFNTNDPATAGDWDTPAAFPASGGTYNLPRCAAKPGRMVAVWWDGAATATSFRSAYSTDGGNNWSAGGTASLATGGPTFEKMNLDYDASLALFVATITDTAGGCKVLTSPDATTWTTVSALSAAKIVDVHCLDGVWCGFDINSFASPVYSIDQGATWRSAHMMPGSNGDFVRLVKGNGQFLFMMMGTSQRLWIGDRCGDVPGTVLT